MTSDEIEPYYATEEEMGLLGNARASDADRDRTISHLNRQYGAGRIDSEAHAIRVDQAMKAKTLPRLGLITKDLPPVRGPLHRNWMTYARQQRLAFAGVLIGLGMVVTTITLITESLNPGAVLVAQALLGMFGGVFVLMISMWWGIEGGKKIRDRDK